MKKREYVLEHYSKEVRKARREERTMAKGGEFNRKKRRVWTLNRSPHGNKTAREQFGRERWQRRVKREGEEGREQRRRVGGGSGGSGVKRKERRTRRVEGGSKSR
jgi:hypothetical protein